MEIKDIVSWIVPLGFMFLMMRFGGCCGGHRHNEGQNSNRGGGCCGGAGAKDEGPVKGRSDATISVEPAKKSSTEV